MSDLPFPVSKWGDVRSQHGPEANVERVRVEVNKGGGFLIITKEPTGTFDVWVETREEVSEYLATLEVDWEA